MTSTDLALDRIERSIDIDATAERVWQLVSRPGWWINEHDVDPEPDLREEGGVTVLTHPRWGTFRLGTEQQDPPRYIAFRWIDPGADTGTPVQFRIDDRPEGGVRLSVVESGFTELGKTDDAVRSHVQENSSGWEAELAAARRFVESV